MTEVWNLEQLRAYNNRLAGEKKPKYRSKKTEVGGIVFDSEKEAMYYGKLLLLLKAGKIGNLERQVEYELNEGGSARDHNFGILKAKRDMKVKCIINPPLFWVIFRPSY